MKDLLPESAVVTILVATVGGLLVFIRYLGKRVIESLDRDMKSVKDTAKDANSSLNALRKEVLDFHSQVLKDYADLDQTIRQIQTRSSQLKIDFQVLHKDVLSNAEQLSTHRQLLVNTEIIFRKQFDSIQQIKDILDREKSKIQTIIKILNANDLIVTERKD